MKTFLLTAFVLLLFLRNTSLAQNSNSSIDSLENFNLKFWTDFYHSKHVVDDNLQEFISHQKRDFIRSVFYPSTKINSIPNTPQQACTNIDFENGSLSGWNPTTGYNPLYNSAGCCFSSGGAQIVTNGSNTDACAGFPVVAPGGSFSLKLGDANTGGVADRIEQTFAVTASNANFIYKYAVVFEDPGHATQDQPSFQIEMIDSSGIAIPCTFYNVAAGQNIPGFVNSTTCANVVYKPWTSVSVDLTNYIGQNVTIRFTTYDCSLGGHYGYAYIDGSCAAFQQVITDTICVGQTKTLCAPAGYANYVWNGSANVNGSTTQCVIATNPGNYSVQTTQVTGCPGPVFYYNLNNFPTPNANFNIGNSNTTCGLTVNFHNTSSMSSGSITTYNWNFGDGTSSVIENPSHTYANPGTYTVSLIVGSIRGCYDTTSMVVTVNPDPGASFTFNNGCQLSPISFIDNSNVNQGNINQWNWSFGDGTLSSLQNPSHGYLNPGTYTVQLSVTTNFGCTSSQTQTISIFENPNSLFSISQTNPCALTVSYNNLSTSSQSTVLQYQWSLGNGGFSSLQNPSATFTNYGNYNVQLVAIDNNGCSDTAQLPLTIQPYPIASFNASSVCANAATSFTNSSSVATGSVVSYQWQFGDGTSSNLFQSSHQYNGAGNYLVSLNVTSNYGCTNSTSQMVSVYPMPVAAFVSSHVCLGNNVTYTNTSTVSLGSITNYVWDFNSDGNPDNTSINPTNLFNTVGNYTTQLMAITNYNCATTYTALVKIFPLPNVLFTANTVCEGSIMSFTNQSTVASGQITGYNWSFGDATSSSSVFNPSHGYTGSGTFNVTLSAVTNNNCTNTFTNTVIVNPKPNPNFLSTITCHNQATQFNNQSSIISGTITKYRWDFDNNGIVDDSTANPSYVYPNAGTLQSRLQAISNNNCSSQVLKQVIVHYNPIANFAVPSTCLPQTTVFNNLSTSNDGQITSYSWDFNGDNVIDNLAMNPQYNYTQPGNYGVKLEVQTEFGCVNTIIKSAYVNPTPDAGFTAINNIGCPSLCVNFMNSSSIAQGQIVTNQWLYGDNSLPEYSTNASHCYQTGNYNVTLKVVSDSGCVASVTMPNMVTVYPQPYAGFNITPSEVDITTPLIEVENQAIGAPSVKYTFSDGTIKNTPSFNHTFNTDVAKDVAILQLVVNEYGCRDSIIKNVKIKPGYALYIPNAFTPNNDGINDGFQAVGIGIVEFKLQIFDRWGALIFESNDINKAWDGSVNGKGDYETTKQEVYVWKARVKDATLNTHELVGHVTLVK